MYLDDASFTLRLARLKVEPLRLWLVYAYFFLYHHGPTPPSD